MIFLEGSKNSAGGGSVDGRVYVAYSSLQSSDPRELLPAVINGHSPFRTPRYA